MSCASDDDSSDDRNRRPERTLGGGEKTEVLKGDQETLNREFERAKEHDACLIMIRGSLQGHRYTLTGDQLSVGRDPKSDITIPDPSISRKHCILFKDGGKDLLLDLGSANGTLVNAKRIPANKPVALSKEDMIRMGNTILKYVPAGEYEILFYSEMDNKAYTDGLTGTNNKRYLLEALEAEFKRAKALTNELSLLILDIDYFKKVNDQYGHDAGDLVLKEFANVIRTSYTRSKDVFARVGGEEFVLLLTNTPVDQAQKIGEKIRYAIETHPFVYDGTRIPVTVSIGATGLTSSVTSSKVLIKTADKALYEAKSGGRNKVVVIR